jgi:hypothetical protein
VLAPTAVVATCERPTSTATRSPTATYTRVIVAIPTVTPSPAPTATAIPTATLSPAPTATAIPTATPSPAPTATPGPTATPSARDLAKSLLAPGEELVDAVYADVLGEGGQQLLVLYSDVSSGAGIGDGWLRVYLVDKEPRLFWQSPKMGPVYAAANLHFAQISYQGMERTLIGAAWAFGKVSTAMALYVYNGTTFVAAATFAGVLVELDEDGTVTVDEDVTRFQDIAWEHLVTVYQWDGQAYQVISQTKHVRPHNLWCTLRSARGSLEYFHGDGFITDDDVYTSLRDRLDVAEEAVKQDNQEESERQLQAFLEEIAAETDESIDLVTAVILEEGTRCAFPQLGEKH